MRSTSPIPHVFRTTATFALSLEEKAQLKELAYETGLSQSDVVRELIRRETDARKKLPPLPRRPLFSPKPLLGKGA